MKNKLISFDIFDTLIARKCGTPQNTFDYIEKIIMGSHDPEIIRENDVLKRFAYYRRVSEQRALTESQIQRKEYSLEDIYRELEFITGIDADIMDKLKRMELSAEVENCYGIKTSIELLKNHLKENDRVVLISDMYLSANQIHYILESVDPIFKELRIYVSSEQNATKSSGGLFSVVADKEDADYTKWIHYGDNKYSDFTIPKFLGITSVIIDNGGCFAKTFSEIKSRSLFWAGYLEGVSKKLSQDRDMPLPKKMGIYWGGPICFGYVNWIIVIALKRHFDHLYFIARDGYVLKIVADRIIKNNGLDIKTSYIYGSRKAWRNEDNAELIGKYIEQNIDFKDNRFALVDTQGSGRSVSKFAEKIFSRTSEKTNCFLFDKIDDYQSEYCRFYSMCSATDSALIEHLCRAPHGVALGYADREGVSVPIIAEQQKWEYEEYKKTNSYAEGVAEFANELSMNSIAICEYDQIADVSIDYLKALNKSCEREVTDYFGDMHFSSNMIDMDMLFAPKLTNVEVETYMKNYLCVPESYYGCSFDYSLRRCSYAQKMMLQLDMKNIQKSLQDQLSQAAEKKDVLYPGKPNIVVYGAGKNGIKVCSMLVKSHSYNIVAWADIDYKSKEIYNVCSIDEALEREYDYIVITIKNENVSESARDMLISCGADEKKIVTADIFMRQFYAK